MLAAMDYQEDCPRMCFRLFTLDVSMEFPFFVQILQSPQELTGQDCNVFFSEDASFHLPNSQLDNDRIGYNITKSEHEPPEQYSMMIQRCEPFKKDP